MMFIKQLNQFLDAAATHVVLIAVVVRLGVPIINSPSVITLTQVGQPNASLLPEIGTPAMPVISGGKLKWKFKTGGMIATSATIAHGLVYFGSMDKHLYAVDKQTGKEKWKFETKGGLWSTPMVAAGTIYFGSYDFNFYAVWLTDNCANCQQASSIPPHYPLAPGVDGGLGAVVQMELAEGIANVTFDRFLADDQSLDNFRMAQAANGMSYFGVRQLSLQAVMRGKE